MLFRSAPIRPQIGQAEIHPITVATIADRWPGFAFSYSHRPMISSAPAARAAALFDIVVCRILAFPFSRRVDGAPR
jgi:hypothetical protein